MGTKKIRNKNIQLNLGQLDHYTLIVYNAEAVRSFHTNILGFKHIETKLINTGTAREGESDMKNFILLSPDQKHYCVITEGLTNQCIFKQYLDKYGEGVHHIAFQTSQIESSFKAIKSLGIKTTTEEIVKDFLSGMRQFFIAKEYAGYFVEIMERTTSVEQEDGYNFVNDNMTKLATSINQYI